MHSIILFLVISLFMFIIDSIWLGVVAKHLYLQNLGALLRKSGETLAPIAWSGVLVYVCLAIGLVVFVLPKANGDYWHALIYGALFGLVVYGIYDFTNYSLVANWPFNITFIDLAWGMVSCGLASLFAAFVQNRFL